jgi:hypothetical protein
MAGFINRGSGISFAPGEGPAAAKETTQAKSTAAAAALRKLQSGQTLTSAERTLLGMSVIPPSPTTSNFNSITGSTVSQPAAPAPVAPAPAPAASAPSAPTVESIPIVQATPPEITTDTTAPPADTSIKAAPIDTVLFVDEGFSQEFITDLLFEDIAGQELLSIARDDTVNGQEVIYQPIKNLGILRDTYDINNLLKIQETSDRFFANFTINLFEKIPRIGNGPDGKNYYFDEVTGDGTIEFINMRNDEQVEVQISNAGIIEEVGI